MIVIRIIGRIFIAFAAVVLAFAAVVWLAGVDLHQQAGRYWFAVHSESLNMTQAVVQRYLHPRLWENVVVDQLLLRPLWEALARLFAVCAVLGGILVAGARRRRPRRGPHFNA